MSKTKPVITIDLDKPTPRNLAAAKAFNQKAGPIKSKKDKMKDIASRNIRDWKEGV